MHEIRIQSNKNAGIYRIVQVPATMTIFDFDTVISAAFAIKDDNEVLFKSVRLNGKRNSQIIALYNNEDDEFESLEETVGNWFKKLDDEMHYIHEAGIHLKLTLEKMIDIGELEASIIEGQGDLFSRRKNIDVNQLNEALQQEMEMEQQFLSEGLNSFLEFLEPDYLSLFEVADEFKKLKPWQYFDNGDIIAVQLNDMKYFITVMGAGGQEYGIMMYDEVFGYPSLEKIINGEPITDDFAVDLSALTVNYVDRSELDKEDYELIKEEGLSFRGKKNWIAFKAFEPGFVPALPNNEQVDIMIVLIEMMIEITKSRMRGWQYPVIPHNSFPLFERQADDNIKMLGIITLERIENGMLEIEVNDLEVAKVKKKPKSPLEIEYDYFYLPYAVMDEDDRPMFPLIKVMVDHNTGEILHHEIVPYPKHAFVQQLLFWETLKELAIRPSNIYVTQDTYRSLHPVAQLVGLKLSISNVPNVEEFKEMVKFNPPF